MKSQYTHIEITGEPPGFPPDWVRKFWVGIIIPLTNPVNPIADGIKWNPRTGEVVTEVSFAVKTEQAVNALRENSEKAYEWFVENKIVERYPDISFQSAYCKLVVNGFVFSFLK